MSERASVVWIWAALRWRTDRGASLVEYALLLALIVVVCIASLTFLGVTVSSKFSSIGKAISSGS